ncbi:MAG: RpiR family transcriptional regulator [Spirochaetales bacterium]|nr:MAG: RpiR family transcriptional regulator [Spirochaetales bacterium]
MYGCILKIREILEFLTPSERKVAEFILENPEGSVGLSILELAERSGGSKAAVIRFCKSLGFGGYRDFSIKLASDTALNTREDVPEYTDIQVGDDLQTLIRNISHNNKKSIDDTLQVLDFQEVERAVEILRRARRIDFYGMGASSIIAQDAQQKFVRINRYANAFTDSHLQAAAATILAPEDAAVFISYSGETREILEILEYARQSGAATIAITRYGKNRLAERADVRLQISSPETSMRSAAASSRIAQLNIIDILFTRIASLEYPRIKEYLDKTRRIRKPREGWLR